MSKNIVMLVGTGDSTQMLYHALKDDFIITKVIIEHNQSKIRLLKNRVKKLGFLRVLDQIIFQLVILPLLKMEGKNRRQQILQENNLITLGIPENECHHIESVNSAACRNILGAINPDVIIVNGTRIISKRTLKATTALFINIHAGITPKYRGVHGGYWALSQNDAANCGVTIHCVDSGIDTGGILAQKNIRPTKRDNFTTYPLLQLAAGINLMKEVIRKKINDREPKELSNDLESKLWFHPRASLYLLKRCLNGIR